MSVMLSVGESLFNENEEEFMVLRSYLLKKQKSVNVISKVKAYVKVTIPSMNDITFKQHFRMSRSTFDQLSMVCFAYYTV